MSFQTDNFKKYLESFVTQIQLRKNLFEHYQQHPHFLSILQCDLEKFTSELILNDSFRRFMIDAKFWNFLDTKNIESSIDNLNQLFSRES